MSNSSIWPIDRILSGAAIPGQSGLGSMAMKRYFTFPKLLHYWSFIIRLFNVISKKLAVLGGGLTPLQRYSQCILQLQLTGLKKKNNNNWIFFTNINGQCLNRGKKNWILNVWRQAGPPHLKYWCYITFIHCLALHCKKISWVNIKL